MPNQDLPSALDYKDQALTLDEIQQRERTGVQPLRLGTDSDLPSSLDYKDQGLTVEEIQARRQRTSGQTLGLEDVPSSIGYKDQSQTIEELRNRDAARSGAASTVPSRASEPETGEYIIAHAVEVPNESDPPKPGTDSERKGTTWRCSKRSMVWVVLGVAALVAVIVVLVLALGGSGDNSGSFQTTPDDDSMVQPTSPPTTQQTRQPTWHPTSIPTLTPTALSWNQLGQDLQGEVEVAFLGDTISLSSDGRTVAANSDSFEDGGQVKVFAYNEGAGLWEQLGQTLNGLASGGSFGRAISLASDGRTIVVGDSQRGGTIGQVRVFVFDMVAGLWEQLGQTLNGLARSDLFGDAVALSADGRTMAAGSHEDGGRVRVYTYDASSETWEQLGPDLRGEAAGDQFGRSVALSSDGQTVVAGAPLSDSSGNTAGQVRVFQYNSLNSGGWSPLGQTLNGGAVGDNFGRAVAMSSDGRTVAAGSRTNGVNEGHVRVLEFNPDSGAWERLGQNLNGVAANNFFGTSVSLSANGRSVAGGGVGNAAGGSNAGHVRVFDFNADSEVWDQIGQDLNGVAENNFFGTSVALSADGRTVASGASTNNGGADSGGHVRVFVG
jgi:hypothetical protein